MKILSMLVLAATMLISHTAQSYPNDCSDCGEGGWQKKSVTCSNTVSNKTDFLACYSKSNPPPQVSEKSPSEKDVEEGYIEIGGMDVLENPSFIERQSAIKVFIYNRVAIDHAGNIYFLVYLG